jgi:hypothetical protein
MPSIFDIVRFILITFGVVEWNLSKHQDAGDQDFSDTTVSRKVGRFRACFGFKRLPELDW